MSTQYQKSPELAAGRSSAEADICNSNLSSVGRIIVR